MFFPGDRHITAEYDYRSLLQRNDVLRSLLTEKQLQTIADVVKPRRGSFSFSDCDKKSVARLLIKKPVRVKPVPKPVLMITNFNVGKRDSKPVTISSARKLGDLRPVRGSFRNQ